MVHQAGAYGASKLQNLQRESNCDKATSVGIFQGTRVLGDVIADTHGSLGQCVSFP